MLNSGLAVCSEVVDTWWLGKVGDGAGAMVVVLDRGVVAMDITPVLGTC